MIGWDGIGRTREAGGNIGGEKDNDGNRIFVFPYPTSAAHRNEKKKKKKNEEEGYNGVKVIRRVLGYGT